MSNGIRCSWFYESSADRKNSRDAELRSSFGAYQSENAPKSFNDYFDELAESYAQQNIDIKKDIRKMVGDLGFMEQYRKDLTKPVFEGFYEASPNDPHVRAIVENVNTYWDTKVRTFTESASMAGFLPIATLEFPVLVKQFFSSVLKDIIEVEAIKTPVIRKHIRTTFVVDNQTGEEMEYPKCMFDGTWEKYYNASRGHKIKDDVVPLTDGRLWKYDIIGGLTDGIAGFDQLSFNFRIAKIQVGSELINLPGNGVTVEFSTNGTLVNGDLDFTSPGGTHVEDNISGQVDFKHGTISMAAANNQITGVVFDGYLSNEKNLRSISVRERRQIETFTVEDGPRVNMPFTIEEIDDAAALLDMNYYNRMVDEIVRLQEMTECLTTISFLNNEFKKFNGIKTDTFKLESTAITQYVDLKPPVGFAGDPFKYISTVIQFRLKAVIHMLTNATKLEGLSFVITGNPMATQVLSEFTNWKIQNGSNIGGIDVNSSYGFATDMGANIRVVASNLYDPYTVDPVEKTGNRELVLHVTGYPTSSEHISFRHLKFTSHLMTSQSQTAYGSLQAPAGAYNIVTATNRYKDISMQGIQADLVLLNSDIIYGEAPERPPIMGAPWDGADLTPGNPIFDKPVIIP